MKSTIYIVIYEWKFFWKIVNKLVVKDFENNIFENEVGIHVVVIATQLFQNYSFKMLHSFGIL